MIDLLWLTGVLLCWIPFAAALVRSFGYGAAETEDYIFGTFFGFMLALFWPATLIIWGVSRLVKRSVEADEEVDA